LISSTFGVSGGFITVSALPSDFGAFFASGALVAADTVVEIMPQRETEKSGKLRIYVLE